MIKKQTKSFVIDMLKSLFWALLLVLLFKSVIIEAFKIPTGSMIPTLFVGDHIFVNKFAYGLRVPFAEYFADKPVFLIKRDSPKRGDVVVFKFPKDETVNYIKRVVGLPGDKIMIRNRVLYVNNKSIALDKIESGAFHDYVYKNLDSRFYPMSSMDLFTEKMPEKFHPVLHNFSNAENENWGPVTVPENSVFCMGDNRDFSKDSREWGFVPFENIKGQAMIIWLSYWNNKRDEQFYFRPDRIFKAIN